jgi:hypothetical protein
MILRLLSLFLAFTFLHAADDPNITALRAADDERIAATITADSKRLASIFSDQLRYAHSTGTVDSKSTLIESISTGRTKYNSIRYENREFEILSPGVALMTGRMQVNVSIPDGNIDSVLSFLAVWRAEHGQWRFHAWQSCKVPAAAQR